MSASPGNTPDDAGRGRTMFLMFAAAILISTGMVCVIGLAEAWWTLGVGFAVHVAVTAFLIREIAHVITDSPSPPESPPV